MVGEKIRKLRESQGYTQSSLGDILNLSPSTIGMYEQGRRLPDIETLVRMCQIFNVSSDYILEMTDNPKPYKRSTSNENIYQRLKSLIEDVRDVSTVAEMVKIRKSRLEDILSGKAPNINELQLLSECFGESTDYILCMTDEHMKRDKILLEPESFQYRLDFLMDSHTELEIADKLDISIMRLRKYASGEEIPSSAIIEKLANIFEVSTDFLLGLRKKTRNCMPSGQYPFSTNELILERIQEILKNDNDEFTAERLGITKDELFVLYHYGFIPHISVLVELCVMGNTSPDYILGFSDSKLIINKGENSDEDSLLKDYRKLNKYYKKKIDGILSEQILQQERDEFLKQSAVPDSFMTGTDNTGK